MRDYIPNRIFCIDGRNIPYPVFTSYDYFTLHDGVEDIESFISNHYELDELVSQIIALKQSCYLLRHTSHSCGSLNEGLYQLKLRLITEAKEKFNYSFDDDWMESLVPFDMEISHPETKAIEKNQFSQPGNNSVREGLPEITKWKSLDAVATEDLAAKLLEKEDFSNYKYPWLAKVIQLSLEYLTLEGLQDACRASEIPDEILDICGEECRDMEQ